jgi:hypothetical protein
VTTRSPIAALVFVVAMLGGAVPSARATTTTTKVIPTQKSSLFSVRASNGYYLEFKAVPEGLGGTAEVTVEAAFEREDELRKVTYSTQGRLFGDGGFEAKFPGIGRVAMHFKQESAHKIPYDGGPYCGEGVIKTRRGVFVGSVGFHGLDGFTTASSRRAAGLISVTARQVCQVPVAQAPEPTPAPQAPLATRSARIYASGQIGPAAVSFSSTGSNIDETGFGAGGLPTIDFEAFYKSELRGMRVIARVYADRPRSTDFSIPVPVGALTDATITPPKPFSGSGIFHLETPTSASWSGDLAAAIPGVGVVPLTGPGMTVQLCEESCAPAPTDP